MEDLSSLGLLEFAVIALMVLVFFAARKLCLVMRRQV